MPYLIAIVVVVLAGAAFFIMRGNEPVTVSETVPVTENMPKSESGSIELVTDTSLSESPDTPVASTAPADTYRDGTHTTNVTYLTPVRNEYALAVSLTLTDDVVTDASIVYSQGAEKDPNAQRFEGAYRSEVIGKKLDDISLSRVGGASLTTGAFNKALVNIKTSAQL